MKFSYCYAGGNMPAIKEFDIESTANIEKGQVVCAEGNVITETVKGAKLICHIGIRGGFYNAAV